MSTFNCTRTVEIRGEEVPVTNGYRFRKAYRTREERARVIAESGLVHPNGQNHWWVESLSARLQGITGQGHMVCLDGDKASCTCPDWAGRLESTGHQCMHILAARLVAGIPEGVAP